MSHATGASAETLTFAVARTGLASGARGGARTAGAGLGGHFGVEGLRVPTGRKSPVVSVTASIAAS